MLSRGAIGASQPGQCDGGDTTDSPRGTRQITTLRNDPMSRPSTPQNAIRNGQHLGHGRHPRRPRPAEPGATRPAVDAVRRDHAPDFSSSHWVVRIMSSSGTSTLRS